MWVARCCIVLLCVLFVVSSAVAPSVEVDWEDSIGDAMRDVQDRDGNPALGNDDIDIQRVSVSAE